MINPARREHHIRNPWPCLIVDDFLAPGFFETEMTNLRIGEYQRVANDPYGVEFQALGSIGLARFFMGAEFREFVSVKTAQTWVFDPTSWIQLRRTTPASVPLPPHTDQLPGRQAVALFYLNLRWTPADGGELVLMDGECGDELAVAPRANRLVFFESNDQTWHRVQPVRGGERLNVGWEMKGHSR